MWDTFIVSILTLKIWHSSPNTHILSTTEASSADYKWAQSHGIRTMCCVWEHAFQSELQYSSKHSRYSLSMVWTQCAPKATKLTKVLTTRSLHGLNPFLNTSKSVHIFWAMRGSDDGKWPLDEKKKYDLGNSRFPLCFLLFAVDGALMVSTKWR